jgi:hypothetical protein
VRWFNRARSSNGWNRFGLSTSFPKNYVEFTPLNNSFIVTTPKRVARSLPHFSFFHKFVRLDRHPSEAAWGSPRHLIATTGRNFGGGQASNCPYDYLFIWWAHRSISKSITEIRIFQSSRLARNWRNVVQMQPA